LTKLNLLAVFFLLVFGLSGFGATAAHAEGGTEVATVGVGGYDTVSYFKGSGPVRGNGRYTAEYQGVTYLFSNEANKNAFEKEPQKYLPAFGGYCAYGVAIEKKFWGDPQVWEIVDGTLYLNLDKSIQQKWDEDKPGYIKKADGNWDAIKGKSPGDL
jgi:YHS domain-containing protein